MNRTDHLTTEGTESTEGNAGVTTKGAKDAKRFAYRWNQEMFWGEFPTEEAAINEAFAERPEAEFVHVGEIEPPLDPEQHIDADLLIEHVQCQDDYSSEAAEGWPGESHAQRDELTAEVQKVFADWIKRHGLEPTFFSVPTSRRIERAGK